MRLQTRTFSHPLVVLIILTVLGFILRIYGIDKRCFSGDEYYTIEEAKKIGLNLQSLPYFLMLNQWMRFGLSEFWLRLFSTIWGTLWIPVMYLAGKQFLNEKTGFYAALLAAFSPFAITYSQQVRFYTFFLFAATVSFWLFFAYVKNRKSVSLIALAGANFLVISSHFFGFVTPVVEGISYFIEKGNQKNKIKRTCIILSIIFLISVSLLIPQIRSRGLEFVQRYVHIRMYAYTQSRGMSPASFLKIPMTFFFFIFGEYVYPLDYFLVIPGLIIYGMCFCMGLKHFAKEKFQTVFTIVAFLIPMSAIYLIFDPLAPKGTGTSVRYLIFILPIFYLIIAKALSFSRYSFFYMAGAVLVNLFSIFWISRGAWAYSDYVFTDWHRASRIIQTYQADQSLLIYDGRAADPIRYYFPKNIHQRSVWDLMDISQFKTVLWVSYDWKEDNRIGFNHALEKIQKTHFLKESYIDYPLFLYVFQKGIRLQDQSIAPVSVYGLPFKDLKLPLKVSYLGDVFEIKGAFTIASGSQEKIIDISDKKYLKGRFIVLSNLTEAGALPDEAEVAQILVRDFSNHEKLFSLRKGVHTDDWGVSFSNTGRKRYFPIFSWKKRLALVGQQQYKRSWQEFEARIYGVELGNLTIQKPKEIVIRYTASHGEMNIWGFFIKSDKLTIAPDVEKI